MYFVRKVRIKPPVLVNDIFEIEIYFTEVYVVFCAISFNDSITNVIQFKGFFQQDFAGLFLL